MLDKPRSQSKYGSEKSRSADSASDERSFRTFSESGGGGSGSGSTTPPNSNLRNSSNPYCHLFPSLRTVRESAQLVRDAFVDLSFLGRFQSALLLANLIGTFVSVFAVASAERQHADVVSEYFGIEFIVCTALNIIYTVCVENTYAFYALILLQLEVVAFVTTSATVGVLTTIAPAGRWAIVAVNWASIFTFLLLQRVVRKSWGWHAYRLAGASALAVKAYAEYQQFAALLLLDLFHAVFFVTAETVVRQKTSVVQKVVVCTVSIGTVVLARILQMTVRFERKAIAWFLFSVYVAGLGCYVYFAIVSLQNAVFDKGYVLDDGHNFGKGGERALIAAVECCVVVVRIGLLSAIARVIASFSGTLPQMFPRRGIKQQYLIDDSVVEGGARQRAVSTASTSPRHVRMYDASARTSALVTTAGAAAASNVAIIDEVEEEDSTAQLLGGSATQLAFD